MSNPFHLLKIKDITYPIKEATTITFDVPDQLYQAFNYQPGQHIVIKFIINGSELRRSYSLNSCPFQEEDLQVTVKRVANGLVSNYVADKLKIGDTLEVMKPQGRFFANVQKEDYKTYFLFAAGSGITPIISILKSALIASPYSTVNLFYGNKNQKSIIFKSELDDLAKQYPQRLQIVHTLSDPKVWTAWQQWTGRKGRMDEAAVEWFINHHPPIAQNTHYYICGPGAMNLSIRNTLIQLGIPKELIHIEQFGAAETTKDHNIIPIDQAQLTAHLNGQSHQLSISKGQTILQVLKAANVQPPYSCESGVCGTCVAKVQKGEVAMRACMALEEAEINQGKVLTCQALPLSDVIEVRF